MKKSKSHLADMPERAGGDIYALIGNPVGHSLSPAMFSGAFRAMGLDARYVSFVVEDLENALKGIRALGIRGVSVTIPHKVDVMKYLDRVDEEARMIGAVNTIYCERGNLKGANTDWLGIVMALEQAMDIRGSTFTVLGAGGTARAALFGIIRGGGLPLLVNRTEKNGRLLSREWGCPFQPLSDIGQIKTDCLINTTPVGMFPHINRSPIPPEAAGNFRWIMDVIYNPLETLLLRQARQAGCGVLSGMDMFVHQGAEQVKLWTGQEPPRALMRHIVRKWLTTGVKGKERA